MATRSISLAGSTMTANRLALAVSFHPLCVSLLLWKDGALKALKRALKGKATTAEARPVGKSTV